LNRSLIIILFLASTYTFADFDADVINIVDGDTIDVLDTRGEKLRIRLLGIDAPEKAQPFGKESMLYLKKIINGNSVRIISKPDMNKPYTLGFYKRVLGKIILNKKDINLEMIKEGMAWHFKKYKKSQPIEDRQSYNIEEHKARKKNIGLWSNDNPLAPWKCRRLNKKR
jgi:endonuclease YncB( thermonuclease family)